MLPMITVRLLGSVDIHDSDGNELETLLRQPKRVALLSYLAAAVPRGFHRRDTLMGLFWPDSTQHQARHALSQALHVLRQELGEGAIVTRGEGEVVAIVTPRFKPFTIDGKTVHEVGLPWHFSWQGLAQGATANFLTPHVGDGNTMIPEYKAFLVDIRKAV